MRKSSTNLTLTITILLVQGYLLSGSVYSQAGKKAQPYRPGVVPAETEERLRVIYEGREFSAKSFRAKWHQDGSSYLILETVKGKNVRALVSYDAASGKRRELISTAQLVPQGATEPLTIQNYLFSPDGSRILLQANSNEDGNRIADYWMLERKSGTLKKVVAGRSNSISPDGQRILYSDQGNLHVYDLQNERKIPLTRDTIVGSVSNGRAVWSPDGNRIAYVQSDESGVRFRSMLIPGDPTYPEVRENRYARVGGTISTLRIGVVDAEGKETRWLSIPVPSEGYYLGQVSWAGNSDELLVEKLSRGRDKREFLIADIRNGLITSIFQESSPDWVIASYRKNAGLEWIRDHEAFLLMSEKDGWRHAYIYSRDGREQLLLTPGDFDIIERVMVDEAGGWFYYNASPDNGTQKYLYRVRLDGTGEPERVTPMNQPGAHDYNISPDGRWAFHTYSTFDTPPITELVQLPEHRIVRVLEDNKELHKKIESLIFHPTEFFQLDIGGGVIMDAWMIKPRDFDPSRKYPVFVYVYGEPHGQTVLDVWGRSHADYHRVIADLGYLVVSMDNRGTPAPKGAAWRRVVSGSLGPLSTEEQAAGLQELGRTRPYVDLSRVGIWGWSGGGSNTLNAMFRKPDVYHVGIAVAAKPQPHLYNAWFQEIYMKTPEVNPDGYRESAPINFAEGLEGDLLIIHGTGETNTHVQIMEGLVDRLIELGKQFDYMTYPNRSHGLRVGQGTPLHLRMHMARYLLMHLPPGPR
ncbi:Dipeptidyl aminopeptidase 4 [subsurface metagenome]